MRLTVFILGVAIVVLLAIAVDQAAGDKHEIIKKIVLKKAFKALKKAPKLIPFVIPLPIIKHHPKHHEVWKVQEVHGGGWENSGGWSSGGGW